MAIGPRSGANQEAVRRHNLGAVLRYVHDDGRVSRSELTARMGLNRSTIAALVGELESLRLVEQVAPNGARTGAGRPSLDVRPVDGSIGVIAVALRVHGLDAALVGLAGGVLARVSRAFPGKADPATASDAIAAAYDELSGATELRMVGVGVGLPGVVEEADGVVRFAPNLGWTDVDLAGLLAERLGTCPRVRIDNDANLGVLSEHIRGAGAGIDDVVFLSGDIGVGGGVITGGLPLRGANGFAGEVGHMRLNPRGRTCRCGSVGCWETEIGASAVARALRVDSVDNEGLGQRLRTIRSANARLRGVGRQLGLGVANLLNVFNPEVVIFGGLLRDLYPVVETEVRTQVQDASMPTSVREAELALPVLGGDSVLLGAAELAYQDLLNDPVNVLAEA